nr:MAG TPA: hypothetical protein [Microviridae sp.]
MKIRIPNKNPARSTDNTISDMVVVEGYTSPEEILERGQLASENTIEALKRMYPKTPELEVREKELMLNKKFNKELMAIMSENKEKIDNIYLAHSMRERIKSLNNEIKSINEQIQQTHETNLIYEKDRKIKELENLLKQATNK